ncbi:MULTISPECIES: polymorphic toxin type 30 domain-containing protein [Streptomyces]|uniref:Polymorphic toxin type 30 domain-containing protein n=1 Tax=Streptomyces caniscabiei TaxID=2746961 RepID=A0ABU4MNF3_9ACTN|nr:MULTISPECIES: polymorphic toxin type 30 domain-containing protein [Streptomyces]MDX2944706.1 polymorphic toxin type 30 domain-containing protein [Streptomyces caniscabiei]MDX2950380.1 polymorphic toxin type 30 domain-containing protein [Streptomyces caniscabiei]MDX2988563.1 polymorphic toxin type 30 domain-containing protein [Streptomyces caniscabiei]MDX3011360.1 polymorphic toxin type 30 domain-containing protein [Streptomyces caniscabiei]MDX3038986.1 polymorphic toxin type 30 domain-conta
MEKWTQIPGGAAKGSKWKWTDPVTGRTVRLRVHSSDPSAPAGSNAAKGDIVRIQIGNQFQDITGKLYHKNVHKPASENYNAAAANATHIP